MLEEPPQTLEEIEDGIVARRNRTGGLACSYITEEFVEKRIQRTYI